MRIPALTGASLNASGATPRFDLYFLSNGARGSKTCNIAILPSSRIGS